MRNELQAAIDRLQESYKRMTIFGCLDDDDARYMDALATALTALRDMLKRRDGCWHCHGIEAHEIDCITEIEDIYLQRIKTAEHIPYRYCASCGRKLEDEK